MKRLQHILSKAGIDGFLAALVLVIALAYFFPHLGIMEKPVSLEKIAVIGVSGVFFFYGLKLNVVKLKEGIANWRMHVLIQFTTFVIFPLIMLAIKPLFEGKEANEIWAGLFFLSALPSTVSSSVVMVSMAGGNVPGAIFNASISALIGVFITPLWISLCLPGLSNNADSTDVVVKLLVQVLLPVCIGMLLNKYGGAFAKRNKKGLRLFDQTIILIIIYASFSKSFTSGLFNNTPAWTIVLLGIGVLVLFFIVLMSVQTMAKFLKFNRKDTIASIFCGSKKSLVHGTVMSKVLFAGNPMAGIILLPLMMYHALQIIASGIIAQRLAKEKE